MDNAHEWGHIELLFTGSGKPDSMTAQQLRRVIQEAVQEVVYAEDGYVKWRCAHTGDCDQITACMQEEY